MNEQELLIKIEEIVNDSLDNGDDETLGMSKKILALLKESGWKSPEEVQELQDKIDFFYERDAGASI